MLLQRWTLNLLMGSSCMDELQVTGYTGPEKLGQALYGADLVLIPAGIPRKPGMTRDDLFNINAGTFGGSVPFL